MSDWARYLIAFVVACHGLVYIPYGIFVPAQVKSWTGSRLLGAALPPARARAARSPIHVVTGEIFLACALAIAAAPIIPGWWRPLGIAGGLAGSIAFATFWDGRADEAVEEGAIGVSISLMVLAAALVLPQLFG